jgi:hypothetical protein
MVASRVAIQTIGKADNPPVILTIKAFADGWSYEVQDLTSGTLPLPWRAETKAEAEKRLKESYDSTVWKLTVLESDGDT